MKQYLVIQFARFGDLIQTKRLVKSLQAEKGAEVHICLDSSLEALGRIIYPNAILHPLTAHGAGLDPVQASEIILNKNRKTLSTLGKTNFNEVYNLNYSGLNFSLASIFEPDKVKGYRWKNGQVIKGKWASLAMRWSKSRRIGINIMDFWAGYAPKAIHPKDVNPKATPKGGGVGVVTAGRESRRSLPPKLLAAITVAVRKKTDGKKITILGSLAEVKAAREIVGELPANLQDNVENLTGKTNWQELADTVSGLDTLITPDTGTMHLAAHFGIPVTAFFLSSAWCHETGPYGLGHTIFQADTECLPCLESQPCPNDMLCLEGLSDTGLLRYITTRNPEHIPENVLAMESYFDSLGATYEAVAGDDNGLTARNKMRNFLKRHLKTSDAWTQKIHGNQFSGLYIERDWMAE